MAGQKSSAFEYSCDSQQEDPRAHAGCQGPPLQGVRLHDRLYKVFGYTYEDVKDQILPMAENGVEPTLSMGHDAPLAVLSKAHQLLFNYFKQLFAQVTNPPIDSLREKIVTDTTVYIGSDGDLLKEKSGNCTVLEVDNPILTGVDLLKIRSLDQDNLPTVLQEYFAREGAGPAQHRGGPRGGVRLQHSDPL